VNDVGQFVWLQTDSCGNPPQSGIVRMINGKSEFIQGSFPNPHAPSQNNLGDIAWSISQPGAYNSVVLWQNGHARVEIRNAAAPLLNDRGDIAFSRWNGSGKGHEACIRMDGKIYQVTKSTEYSSFPQDVNNQGEFTFQSWDKGFQTSQIWLVRKKR
jgi:hypothetical protein